MKEIKNFLILSHLFVGFLSATQFIGSDHWKGACECRPPFRRNTCLGIGLLVPIAADVPEKHVGSGRTFFCTNINDFATTNRSCFVWISLTNFLFFLPSSYFFYIFPFLFTLGCQFFVLCNYRINHLDYIYNV